MGTASDLHSSVPHTICSAGYVQPAPKEPRSANTWPSSVYAVVVAALDAQLPAIRVRPVLVYSLIHSMQLGGGGRGWVQEETPGGALEQRVCLLRVLWGER